MKTTFLAISFFINIFIVINGLEIHFDTEINSHNQALFKKDDDIKLTCHLVLKNETLNKLVLKFKNNDKDPIYSWDNSTGKLQESTTQKLSNSNVTKGTLDKDSKVSVTILKANSTDLQGNYTCDVTTNKDKNSSDINIKFWDGNIEKPKIHLRSNDAKKENLKPENKPIINKGEAFIIDCEAKIDPKPKQSYSVVIMHKNNPIDKYDNKTNKNVPTPEKDGINVESLSNTTASIKVTDKDKKAEGDYKCEYTVEIETIGKYTISSDQITLKVNAGTTFKLSFSVVVISLISVFYSVSK